jgi:hypothetical protein
MIIAAQYFAVVNYITFHLDQIYISVTAYIKEIF